MSASSPAPASPERPAQWVKMLSLVDLGEAATPLSETGRPREWIRELSLESLFVGPKDVIVEVGVSSKSSSGSVERKVEIPGENSVKQKVEKLESLEELLGKSAPAATDSVKPKDAGVTILLDFTKTSASSMSVKSEKLAISRDSSFEDTKSSDDIIAEIQPLEIDTSHHGMVEKEAQWPRRFSIDSFSTEGGRRVAASPLRHSPTTTASLLTSRPCDTLGILETSTIVTIQRNRSDSSSASTSTNHKKRAPPNLRIELGKSFLAPHTPKPILNQKLPEEEVPRSAESSFIVSNETFRYPDISTPHTVGPVQYAIEDSPNSCGCFGKERLRPPLRVPPLLVDAALVPRSMKMRSAVVMVDARRGVWRRSLEIVQALMWKHGVTMRTLFIKNSALARDLALSLENISDSCLIVIGGDEVFGDAVTGLMRRRGGLEEAPAVGFVGSGLASGVITTLGLEEVSRSVMKILSGRVRKIDVGQARISGKGEPIGIINCCSWGTGLYNISSVGAASSSNGWGVTELMKNESGRVRVEMDGVAVEANVSSLVVMLSQYSPSGILAVPHAVLDDGMADVMAIEAASRIETVSISKEMKRHGSHVYSPRVHSWRARSIILTPPPLVGNVSIDGLSHTIQEGDNIQIEILPRALRILC